MTEMGRPRWDTPRDLELGDVIQGGFSAASKNVDALLAVVLPFCVVPNALYQGILAWARTPGAPFGSTAPLMAAVLGGWLLLVAGEGLARAGLTQMVVADADRRRASPGECLRVAMQSALTVIAAELLYVIGMTIGLVLLIVPGLMVLAAWSLWVPVVAIERKPLSAAFTRGLELTRNQRWPVFWGIFLMRLIGGLFAGALGLAARMFLQGASPIVSGVFVGVVGAVAAALGLLASASAYSNLVRIKGGAGVVAKVFD